MPAEQNTSATRPQNLPIMGGNSMASFFAIQVYKQRGKSLVGSNIKGDSCSGNS